jgi:hypothetical protein
MMIIIITAKATNRFCTIHRHITAYACMNNTSYNAYIYVHSKRHSLGVGRTKIVGGASG